MRSPCSIKNEKAWIINIGTELLLGVTINTNASWIARKLAYLGYETNRIIVVPDIEKDVIEEVRRGVNNRIGIIITTGGLGPTYDDNTAKFIARAINKELVKNKTAFNMVLEKYREMGEDLTPPREKMAYLPEGSIPIPNKIGTAPGFLLCYEDTMLISLPGVPREMKSMFEEFVEPILREYSRKSLIEEKMLIKGIKESSLAPLIEYLAKKYVKAYIKSHPRGYESNDPVIELQISVVTEDLNEGKKLIEEIKKELHERISIERERGLQ